MILWSNTTSNLLYNGNIVLFKRLTSAWVELKPDLSVTLHQPSFYLYINLISPNSTLSHLSSHLSLEIKFSSTSRKSRGSSLKFKKVTASWNPSWLESKAFWCSSPLHCRVIEDQYIKRSLKGHNDMEYCIRETLYNRPPSWTVRGKTVAVHVLMYFNCSTTCCRRGAFCMWVLKSNQAQSLG